jgi:hypothetical protein
LAMEWCSTEHTMFTLHDEKNDALRIGTCAPNPPSLRPIWVEADWAGGAIICEGLRHWPKNSTWAVCGLG